MNMPINEWEHISKITIDDNINTIHCDTRDFHCLVAGETINLKDGKHPEITKRVYNEEYNIPESQIIPWFESLEKMSGGNGNWRMLNFSVPGCDGWLKYIRLYRNPKRDGMFIVCNRDSQPIKWKLCVEDNLDKDHVCYQKE